jgi:hypothetical protein
MRFVGVKKSKWANPYKIARDGTREEVIKKYRDWLSRQPELMAALPELRGKDLACWSPETCCHAEVLLELANEMRKPTVFLFDIDGTLAHNAARNVFNQSNEAVLTDTVHEPVGGRRPAARQQR